MASCRITLRFFLAVRTKPVLDGALMKTSTAFEAFVIMRVEAVIANVDAFTMFIYIGKPRVREIGFAIRAALVTVLQALPAHTGTAMHFCHYLVWVIPSAFITTRIVSAPAIVTDI